MFKVMSLATLVLFSSAALAGVGGAYNTKLQSETMSGEPVASKQAALDAGKTMIMDINSKSPFELSRAVSYSSNDLVDVNSFELRDSHVTVNEIVTSAGEIAYQPVINVSYEFRARDRD